MASIHREILIDAPPEQVWDAARDVAALHTRLVPGFVTDTRLEEGARIVTFGNGNEQAPQVAGMMDEGLAAMKKAMESENRHD